MFTIYLVDVDEEKRSKRVVFERETLQSILLKGWKDYLSCQFLDHGGHCFPQDCELNDIFPRLKNDRVGGNYDVRHV